MLEMGQRRPFTGDVAIVHAGDARQAGRRGAVNAAVRLQPPPLEQRQERDLAARGDGDRVEDGVGGDRPERDWDDRIRRRDRIWSERWRLEALARAELSEPMARGCSCRSCEGERGGHREKEIEGKTGGEEGFGLVVVVACRRHAGEDLRRGRGPGRDEAGERHHGAVAEAPVGIETRELGVREER